MDRGRGVSRPATGAELLLACYRRGVFPMAQDREDDFLQLVDPELRGVAPIQDAHVPRRLARTVRGRPFEIRVNTAFREVVAGCAAPDEGREGTWISRGLEAIYVELYLQGYAHSVECWREGDLVGGLYGVALGGAFFGESMFSRARDASKVALVHLIARLRVGGFTLLDTQFITAHLRQFGAVEIPRREYLKRLEAALAVPADFFRLPPQADGAALLQAISQRS